MRRPRKALSGLRPKVLKSRLNHTTSGFSFPKIFRMRTALEGSLNDQQRNTEKPSISGCGGEI